MKTILDLQPAIVWKYFYEITQVPRPSKKEGKIIQYLEDFAAQHHLPIKKDSVGNILISKAATPGYEQLPTIVLQSHMDMVCEKEWGDHSMDFEAKDEEDMSFDYYKQVALNQASISLPVKWEI